jgi:hypothetical protein
LLRTSPIRKADGEIDENPVQKATSTFRLWCLT